MSSGSRFNGLIYLLQLSHYKMILLHATTFWQTCRVVPFSFLFLRNDDVVKFPVEIGKERKEKIEYVLSILNNNESYTKLFNFINNQQVVCAQIAQPNTNSSYKKHITDVVNASITNTPYSVDLVEKYKDKNNWQLFIDNREKRLCFVIWSINEELY